MFQIKFLLSFAFHERKNRNDFLLNFERPKNKGLSKMLRPISSSNVKFLGSFKEDVGEDYHKTLPINPFMSF